MTKKNVAAPAANVVIVNAEKQVNNQPKAAKVVKLSFAGYEGKKLRQAKAEAKRGVRANLGEFGTALDAALSQTIKGQDAKGRNAANAAKGRFRSAAAIVEACFPYQTADGVLCRKVKNDDGVKIWAPKPYTAAGARGIVREALYHFIATNGAPEPAIVVIGEPVQ